MKRWLVRGPTLGPTRVADVVPARLSADSTNQHSRGAATGASVVSLMSGSTNDPTLTHAVPAPPPMREEEPTAPSSPTPNGFHPGSWLVSRRGLWPAWGRGWCRRLWLAWGRGTRCRGWHRGLWLTGVVAGAGGCGLSGLWLVSEAVACVGACGGRGDERLGCGWRPVSWVTRGRDCSRCELGCSREVAVANLFGCSVPCPSACCCPVPSQALSNPDGEVTSGSGHFLDIRACGEALAWGNQAWPGSWGSSAGAWPGGGGVGPGAQVRVGP